MSSTGWVLVVLLTAGVLIRGIACAALWPTATTLSDAANYAADAASNPLADPQHPAGYPALLAVVGVITRNVAVTILLQHALGIATAVLLFASVRRLVGSPWPALIPAAVVLLDSDQIFLEHNVMSDGPFLFIFSLALYAGVRSMDARLRTSWRWSLLAAITIGAAAVVRSAGVFAVPVLALAIALGRPAALGGRWRISAAFLAVTALLLAGFAFVNLEENGRFEVAPASGWHLYARVASFADCRRFTPPAGTAGLCESTPAAWRWGPDFYLYAARSPARRLFGRIGSQDGKLGAFALRVVLKQPEDLAAAFWTDVRRYFVPSWRPHGYHGWYTGWDIEPQLDWQRQAGAAYTRDTITGMEKFFSHFVPRRDRTLAAFMHDYQQAFGFGATLLTVCTALTLLGLFVGSPRNRVGVLLFGVGGLAQVIGPTVGVLYMGRYAVSSAGLVAAGAAISAWSLVHERDRRRACNVSRPGPPRLAEEGVATEALMGRLP